MWTQQGSKHVEVAHIPPLPPALAGQGGQHMYILATDFLSFQHLIFIDPYLLSSHRLIVIDISIFLIFSSFDFD